MEKSKEISLPVIKRVPDDVRRFLLESQARFDEVQKKRTTYREFFIEYIRTDQRFREWQKQNK